MAHSGQVTFRNAPPPPLKVGDEVTIHGFMNPLRPLEYQRFIYNGTTLDPIFTPAEQAQLTRKNVNRARRDRKGHK